jgi:hypothetical protein
MARSPAAVDVAKLDHQVPHMPRARHALLFFSDTATLASLQRPLKTRCHARTGVCSVCADPTMNMAGIAGTIRRATRERTNHLMTRIAPGPQN